WEIYLQRIHKSATGATQWYDAKAAVPDSLTATGTETGIEIIPDNTSGNDESKIDTNGSWVAKVDEGVMAVYAPDSEGGSLRIWHLPDGAMQYYDVPNPNIGIWPTGKFGSSLLITD